MLGYQDLDRALEVRPRHIRHVDEAVFERLESAKQEGTYASEFHVAWTNGYAFARSEKGLRGRPPWSLEWKGHHKPASKRIETIPADLRIDHVYLISCKYGSKILHNSSPVALFEKCLSGSSNRGIHWYEKVSEEAFRTVWKPIYDSIGLPDSATPGTVGTADRQRIKSYLKEAPLDTSSVDYLAFVADVSKKTCAVWNSKIKQAKEKLELFWRLLRMQSAPYFVLGADTKNRPIRYRVGTPWDFQQKFQIENFDISPGSAGQPTVNWRVVILDQDGTSHLVNGHVEVRWSHGKLGGLPEAKVYLDSPPTAVPGYAPI